MSGMIKSSSTRHHRKIMPRCIRLVALWLFILAFQLFQEPITSTYMCRYKRYKEVISVKDGYNCKKTRVKLGMCVGTCESFAIPVPIKGDNSEFSFYTGCQCCEPKEFIKRRTVRFGEGCEKSIVVSQIRSCGCKNCSRRDL